MSDLNEAFQPLTQFNYNDSRILKQRNNQSHGFEKFEYYSMTHCRKCGTKHTMHTYDGNKNQYCPNCKLWTYMPYMTQSSKPK